MVKCPKCASDDTKRVGEFALCNECKTPFVLEPEQNLAIGGSGNDD